MARLIRQRCQYKRAIRRKKVGQRKLLRADIAAGVELEDDIHRVKYSLRWRRKTYAVTVDEQGLPQMVGEVEDSFGDHGSQHQFGRASYALEVGERVLECGMFF